MNDSLLYPKKLVFRFCLAVCLLVLFSGGLFSVFWATGVEPDLLSVTRLTLVDTDLPDSWDGRVIAFFSDVHAGSDFDGRRLARVAEAVKAAAPDLILIGGDLVDHRTPDSGEFRAAISGCLAEMQAPFGQFAIIGNHDNRTRAELSLAREILAEGGFRLLVNQSVMIDGLWLGGLDESYFGQPDLDLTYPDDDPAAGSWRLLLMHQPDYGAALPADSADLILSGHTHGGQVALLGRPLATVEQGRNYTYGYYPLDDGRQLIVSRGLGTIYLGIRFGAPPELMLITLSRG
ncbi:MAG TPA: metallophosphoesterase [Clostridiales bacterium]|nr:metallophosphoesterase [Clostridiales bacterium]